MHAHSGMSRRDFFAAYAMIALAPTCAGGLKGLAKLSFELADEMVAASELSGSTVEEVAQRFQPDQPGQVSAGTEALRAAADAFGGES